MNRGALGPREFQRATGGRGLAATGRVREASPVLADGVERFIFADVFSRSGLGARERELLTVAVLAALGGADNQLAVHVPAALECGADGDDLIQLCEQIAPYAGFPRALNALRAVRAALEERGLPLPPPVVEVDLGDTATLVTDTGGDDGPALVLLHAPEMDRGMWRDVVRALPPGRRALAPDLRGAGAAAAAPRGDAARLVADVLAVADLAGPGPVRLAAAGGATPLAAAVCQAAPDRVEGVVLVGPVRPGRAGGDPAHGAPPRPADLARWMLPVHLAEDGWGARYARDRIRRVDPDGWGGLVAALEPVDPTDTAGRPVAIVLGAGDAVTAESAAASAWPRADVIHVPDAGHLVALEAPAALAELIRRDLPG